MWHDVLNLAFLAKSLLGISAAFEAAGDGNMLVAACLAGVAVASPIWKLTRRLVDPC